MVENFPDLNQDTSSQVLRAHQEPNKVLKKKDKTHPQPHCGESVEHQRQR